MKEKILIVEDDKDINRLLEFNLSKNQYRPVCASDGEQGLALAKSESPDLIILDIMLPKMDGLEVCRELKRDAATSAIPILMLTAKAEEVDKVVGLEMGADDYVTKPFSPRELLARVGSILRRSKTAAVPAPSAKPAQAFRHGMLTIDFEKYTARFKGQSVDLTNKEFALLKALLDAKGRALSREHLLETVWGYTRSIDVETRTVDAHVTHLRKKLKTLAKHIITVKGIGYRLDGIPA